MSFKKTKSEKLILAFLLTFNANSLVISCFVPSFN
ncbi:putative membrane protein, partial [Acinetobacter baumannii 972082]